MTKDELIVRQSMKIENMTRALKTIADWDLPKVDESKTSYEVAYGSNGARDWMKALAKDALEYKSEYEQ